MWVGCGRGSGGFICGDGCWELLVFEGAHDGGGTDVVGRASGGDASLGDCC